jgi:hypothetical protein
VDIENHHTAVIAHEMGHQLDYATRTKAGGSKHPEFMELAKKVRLKYIAVPNKTHSEKWASYFTSDSELWAAGTEVVMTGAGRKWVSEPNSTLGKMMREEGVSDWLENYYRKYNML